MTGLVATDGGRVRGVDLLSLDPIASQSTMLGHSNVAPLARRFALHSARLLRLHVRSTVKRSNALSHETSIGASWGCSRARDIFEAHQPSPQRLIAPSPIDFRGNLAIWAMYQAIFGSQIRPPVARQYVRRLLQREPLMFFSAEQASPNSSEHPLPEGWSPLANT